MHFTSYIIDDYTYNVSDSLKLEEDDVMKLHLEIESPHLREIASNIVKTRRDDLQHIFSFGTIDITFDDVIRISKDNVTIHTFKFVNKERFNSTLSSIYDEDTKNNMYFIDKLKFNPHLHKI